MTLGHIHNILLPISSNQEPASRSRDLSQPIRGQYPLLPVSSANLNPKLVILSVDNPHPGQHVQYLHHDDEEEEEEEVDEVYEEDPDYNPNEESDEGYRTTSSVTSGQE